MPILEFRDSKDGSVRVIFHYADVTIRPPTAHTRSNAEQDGKMRAEWLARKAADTFYQSARVSAPVNPGRFLVSDVANPGFMFWSVVVSPFAGVLLR
jgi:hypothetical protein